MNESYIKRSTFTELLIRNNSGYVNGLKEWVFCQGMLFNAADKWWGDRGKRSRTHEGLDIYLYRNWQDRIVRLEAGTAVPVMYDGEVVKIMDDFLGKSVIVDHSFTGQRRFCSIYGHTVPRGIETGSRVKEGDIIASIADCSKSKTGLFPHLHITIGLLSGKTSYERMDWEKIGSPDVLTLLDPLDLIGGKYKIQDIDRLICLADCHDHPSGLPL